MLLNDVLDEYINLEEEFQSILVIKNDLEKILDKYLKQKKDFIQHAFSYSNTSDIVQNSSRLLDAINNLKKCLDQDKFQVTSYQRELFKFQIRCKGTRVELFFDYENFIKSAEKFFEKVEEYYQENKNPNRAYIMMDSLDEFIKKIEEVNLQFKSLHFLNEVLEQKNKRELNSEVGILELKLFSQLNLKEVIAALLIIRNMYEQLRYLLEIEEEIEIIKIETGSLFSKLLGDKTIMEMISGILIYVAKDLYNSSLNPLKRDEIRRKEFSELLDLKLKMQKLGINTNGIDKKIEDINNTLFDASEMLIKSTDKIKVNDEIFKMKLPERTELELDYKKLSQQLDYKNN